METLIERMAKKKATPVPGLTILPLVSKEQEHEGECGDGCGCGAGDEGGCCGG